MPQGETPLESTATHPGKKPPESTITHPGKKPPESTITHPGKKPPESTSPHPGEKPPESTITHPGKKPPESTITHPGKKPPESTITHPGEKPPESTITHPGEKPPESTSPHPGEKPPSGGLPEGLLARRFSAGGGMPHKTSGRFSGLPLPGFSHLQKISRNRALTAPDHGGMKRNAYSEINLHINWRVKASLPVLVDQVEERLYRYLHHRILSAPNVLLHAMGGIADHLHIAVSVPPTLPIATWIGELKGASAHHINREIARRKLLEWQSGYGVVSFGTRDLPWVIRYVENQKEHHARGTIAARLERIDGEG